MKASCVERVCVERFVVIVVTLNVIVERVCSVERVMVIVGSL